MADKDEREAIQSSAAASQAMRSEIDTINQKLQRLLDAYLEQDIERDAYRSEKADLLSRKKSLEEQIGEIGRGTIAWLEQFRNWLKDAQILEETAVSPSLPPKKSSAQKIFGSNIFLSSRRIVSTPLPHYDALRASRKNFIESELCTVLVPLASVPSNRFFEEIQAFRDILNGVEEAEREPKRRFDHSHRKRLRMRNSNPITLHNAA